MEGVCALTFDCYGTLIDWEAGVRAFAAGLLARRSAHTTPDEFLARWEPIQFDLLVPYRPYREVLARSVDATLRALGLPVDPGDGPALTRALRTWRPFEDTVPALERLGARYRLCIVSNVDRDLLAGTLEHLGRGRFAALVTAEDARAYKPDPAPLRLALERLGLTAREVLHCAFGWKYDLAPARALGIRTALVRRGGLVPRGVPPADLEVAVAALADRLAP
jgi:2-haloalkanoic acid dehalogenase type II